MRNKSIYSNKGMPHSMGLTMIVPATSPSRLKFSVLRGTLVTCLALVMTSAFASETPIVIGQNKQLFVDDHIVASKSDVARELGTVNKENDGKPIFTEGNFYGTVVFDEGKFKMWWRKQYKAADKEGETGGSGYGYAESLDGLNFTRISDLTGLGDTNAASFYVDPHETDPAHRYKACYSGKTIRACLAHSADGINWQPYNDGKPVTFRAADTYNQILWDEEAGTYRMFTRTDFGAGGGPGEIRGTRGMTNPDLKANPGDWRTESHWIFDREGPMEHKRRQIYAMTDWIYCGVHFGLMTVYEWPEDGNEGQGSEGPPDTYRRHERDVMNFYIATSRDGRNWDLSWIYAGQPMIPRGPDGAFDKDLLYPSSSVVTHGDRHWLYYSGGNERHWAPNRVDAIGLATLRLDGFVALRADRDPGTVLTKPFLFNGRKVVVNVDAREGEIALEVTDQNGTPLPAYAGDNAGRLIAADKLRWEPSWSAAGDLSALNGKIVRLKFHLRGAKLYSFQIQ